MTVDAELILAIVALIGAIVAALEAKSKNQRGLIGDLQKELDRDHDRLEKLETERNDLSDLRLSLEGTITDLQRRLTDAEQRIARAEQRAGIAERAANEFRQDVIRLGEKIQQERMDSQNKINKLVLIIQQLLQKMRSAGIEPEPEVDMELLQRMIVIEGK